MSKRNITNTEKFNEKYVLPFIGKSDPVTIATKKPNWYSSKTRYIIQNQPEHRIVTASHGTRVIRSKNASAYYKNDFFWGYKEVSTRPYSIEKNQAYVEVIYKDQPKHYLADKYSYLDEDGDADYHIGTSLYYSKKEPIRRIYQLDTYEGTEALYRVLKFFLHEKKHHQSSLCIINPYIQIDMRDLKKIAEEEKDKILQFKYTNCFSTEAAIQNLFDGTFDDFNGRVMTLNQSEEKENRFWNILEEDDKNGNFNVARLYHGTSVYAASKILSEGFALGNKGGAFGAGVYFGEISKARSYMKPRIPTSVKDFCKNNRFKNPSDRIAYDIRKDAAVGVNKRALSKACILEVDVALGKCFDSRDNEENQQKLSSFASVWNTTKTNSIIKLLNDTKSNSLYYHGFQNGEYVIYEPARAIVRKIMFI